MALSKYTLTYFDGRWIAEPIRILLNYVGENFEDQRIIWEDWEKTPVEENLKKYKYGKLPFFTERDGNGQVVVELSQSYTILRYLAKKYNLAGATLVEQAKCEEYTDCVKDMLKEVELMFPPVEEQVKVKVRTNLLEKTFPRYFEIIERDLVVQRAKQQKGGDFFPLVGDSLTWADIILAHYTELFQIFMQQNSDGIEAANTFLDKYPTVKAHQKGVFGVDKIKQWIERRPVTPF